MIRASVLLLMSALVVGCAPKRVSSYHQRCLECALRRSADPLGVQEAFRYFTEGCRDGDVPSCSVLGVMYEHGRGVMPDTRRAMDLYRFACLGGNAGSCVNLGRLAESERGDLEGAAVAYQMACQQERAAEVKGEGCARLDGARRAIAGQTLYDE